MDIIIIIKIITALGIFNVWMLRYNKLTEYRGGNARSLKEEFETYGLNLWLMYIIGAIKIGWDAFQSLMDRELSEEHQKQIAEATMSVDGVKGFHGLRTREAGPVRFIQLHIELDNSLSLLRAHAIADDVEAELIRCLRNHCLIFSYHEHQLMSILKVGHKKKVPVVATSFGIQRDAFAQNCIL